AAAEGEAGAADAAEGGAAEEARLARSASNSSGPFDRIGGSMAPTPRFCCFPFPTSPFFSAPGLAFISPFPEKYMYSCARSTLSWCSRHTSTRSSTTHVRPSSQGYILRRDLTK